MIKKVIEEFMAYQYKKNKKKSGRPRSSHTRAILPAISVELNMKYDIESASRKLKISSANFRRTAYGMLVKYVNKKLG